MNRGKDDATNKVNTGECLSQIRIANEKTDANGVPEFTDTQKKEPNDWTALKS